MTKLLCGIIFTTVVIKIPHLIQQGVLSVFGEFVKAKRLALNLSLREFCKRIDEDPSNWSKIERGLFLPPKSEVVLTNLAKALKIEKGSEDWEKLNDLSNVTAGTIPDYIMQDRDIVEALPAFFRTVGNTKPNKEQLQKLITFLKDFNNEDFHQ